MMVNRQLSQLRNEREEREITENYDSGLDSMTLQTIRKMDLDSGDRVRSLELYQQEEEAERGKSEW